MPFEIQGKTGYGYAQDGSLVDPRLTRDFATVVQSLHGHYYETTYRGNTFIASTGVAGVAPGTALTTTPPFTLYNPLNSGVNLSIISASDGYISGATGSGTLVYGINNNTAQAAPSGGTSLIPICTLIGNGSLPKGKAFQGATLAAAPTIFRDFTPIGSTGLGITSIYIPFRDLVESTMIIIPGAALSIQGIAAAGSSPLITISVTWEEIPS